MTETARVVAQPARKARLLWDADDQVANRLLEIRKMCDLVQDRIECGNLPGATRAVQSAKELAKEALELRSKSNRRQK